MQQGITSTRAQALWSWTYGWSGHKQDGQDTSRFTIFSPFPEPRRPVPGGTCGPVPAIRDTGHGFFSQQAAQTCQSKCTTSPCAQPPVTSEADARPSLEEAPPLCTHPGQPHNATHPPNARRRHVAAAQRGGSAHAVGPDGHVCARTRRRPTPAFPGPLQPPPSRPQPGSRPPPHRRLRPPPSRHASVPKVPSVWQCS